MARKMRYAGLNALFTKTVAEYMAKGYSFNTATMGGSQGELGKVDLTDGFDLIRILLEGGTEHGKTETGEWYWLRRVKLIVGKCTDEGVLSVLDERDTWATVWNDKLEVIREENWYEIETRGGVLYTTFEDALEAFREESKGA